MKRPRFSSFSRLKAVEQLLRLLEVGLEEPQVQGPISTAAPQHVRGPMEATPQAVWSLLGVKKTWTFLCSIKNERFDRVGHFKKKSYEGRLK